MTTDVTIQIVVRFRKANEHADSVKFEYRISDRDVPSNLIRHVAEQMKGMPVSAFGLIGDEQSA